jgi:hypothetical protein
MNHGSATVALSCWNHADLLRGLRLNEWLHFLVNVLATLWDIKRAMSGK